MVAIASPLPNAAHGLRPFEARRDLSAVADLVEQCFADTLDPDGRRYIEDMRRMAHSPSYWYGVVGGTGRSSLSPEGFVWQENGRVVGNLSLIPYTIRKQRCYLIANVAVAPRYRRQGIAHHLTAAALEQAKRRGAAAVWLHVRQENSTAVHLYSSLGFGEKTRRTSWEGENGAAASSKEAGENLRRQGIAIVPAQGYHWPQQRLWLQRSYPAEVTWQLPYDQNLLRSDIWGSLYRLLVGAEVQIWSAQRREQLLGVLARQSIPSQVDYLWLATAPSDEEQAIRVLFPFARYNNRRRLILDYPAGRGVQALRETGFQDRQTLIWMERKI
jgi:GNAT superfamily N-acetyltransferase